MLTANVNINPCQQQCNPAVISPKWKQIIDVVSTAQDCVILTGSLDERSSVLAVQISIGVAPGGVDEELLSPGAAC